MRPVALALALALALAACHGQTALEEPAIGDEDLGPTAPVTAAAPTPPPRQRSGEIERLALDQVLAAGPGRFLGTISVEARLEDGHFHGWRVLATPWPAVDLVPGDVVLAVNQHGLERPLELEALWQELGAASALTAVVERDGQTFALRFAIVGGAPAPAAPPPIDPPPPTDPPPPAPAIPTDPAA